MADATKAAEERALENEVNLDDVEGTGKDGRVTAGDVDAHVESAEASRGGGEPDDSDPASIESVRGGGVDTAADTEVDVPSLEDQEEDADQALQAHDIDPDQLQKEAVLPANVQPSGGTIPPVQEQVGPPLTEDQLRQLAEQQAALDAVADATNWEGEKQEPDEPVEPVAPEDADNPEPEPQVEPPPVEALAERDQYKDVSPEDAGELAARGEGGAKVRQVAGASDDSVRQPLLQRPAEEQAGHATHQNSVYQEGETRPGERSLTNDAPAYQTATNHVPGTPLPDEYYETAAPAPQPTLNEKRTEDELDEINAEREDND